MRNLLIKLVNSPSESLLNSIAKQLKGMTEKEARDHLTNLLAEILECPISELQGIESITKRGVICYRIAKIMRIAFR